MMSINAKETDNCLALMLNNSQMWSIINKCQIMYIYLNKK